MEVFDLDLYSQALSKLERGFELDLDDIDQAFCERLPPLVARSQRHLDLAQAGADRVSQSLLDRS